MFVFLLLLNLLEWTWLIFFRSCFVMWIAIGINWRLSNWLLKTFSNWISAIVFTFAFYFWVCLREFPWDSKKYFILSCHKYCWSSISFFRSQTSDVNAKTIFYSNVINICFIALSYKIALTFKIFKFISILDIICLKCSYFRFISENHKLLQYLRWK